MHKLKPSLNRSSNPSNKNLAQPHRGTIPMQLALLKRFHQDPAVQQAVLREAKSAENLVTFLQWYCENAYDDNTFSEGWGETRAYHDGRARQAALFYEVLGRIKNVRSADTAK